VTVSAPGGPAALTSLPVVAPATGALLAEVPATTAAGVAAALERARRAQPAWQALGPRARGQLLRRLARAIRDDDQLTGTLVAETGKPRYEAVGMEVFYTLEVTRYYTGRAGRRALRDELRRPFLFAIKRARVLRQPHGVVGVIGPWNWPLLNNYADCVAPLMAGNAVLLKPSEVTPLTSLRVAELWKNLGLPEGIFQVLPGRGDVGQALCEQCDMIFFTGSVKTGRQVGARCGERMIPVVLELGGKSPMIVLADADLPRAARAAVWSGFANSGQVCIRTERIFVEDAVAERFISLCVAEVKALRQGQGHEAPADQGIDVGAITFAPQIDNAEKQIADALTRGARVAAGGEGRRAGSGRFFAPTLLADVSPDMLVAREETFGPLLPIIRVRDAEEALRLVNELPTGLSGSLWTADAGRARALARRMVAGSVCINDVLMNYFVVEAPLGGVKASGLGVRHGPEALRQFCRLETIIEDQPFTGRLSPIIQKQLMFPYRSRTLRTLRWVMRRLY
jgi:acyl-CoA reductase-like NAD-dependent aldehyde dehydrogenase